VWLNKHLEAKELPPVDNLDESLKNGLNLIHALEHVTGESAGKYHARAVLPVHCIDNQNVVLKFLSDRGVNTGGVTAEGFSFLLLLFCSRSSPSWGLTNVCLMQICTTESRRRSGSCLPPSFRSMGHNEHIFCLLLVLLFLGFGQSQGLSFSFSSLSPSFSFSSLSSSHVSGDQSACDGRGGAA